MEYTEIGRGAIADDGPRVPSYLDRGCYAEPSWPEAPSIAMARSRGPSREWPRHPSVALSEPEHRIQWSVEDVSLATGRCLEKGVAAWTSPAGVENLAGVDSDRHVVVFSSVPGGPWVALDVTAITGVEIVSDLEAWQTPNGTSPVEHLAGHTVDGELIVFWRSAAHDWQALSITAKTGVQVIGRMAAWQTPNGPYNVEHLGGRTETGEVVVFWWSPAKDWQVIDVSAITGERVGTDLVAWQTRNGPFNVEHLAGITEAGEVVVFWWSPQKDWQSINVTSVTGAKVVSALAAWQTRSGRFNVEHLAGSSPDGDLIVFWWSPLHDWQSINASDLAGDTVAGRPASLTVGADSPELLFCRHPDGELLAFWWSPAQDWQALSVSAIAGPGIETDPAAWLGTGKSAGIERVAAVGSHGELLVFEGSSAERDETDAVNSPILKIRKMRRSRRRLLTILWDPAKPGVPAPTPAAVEDLLYGPGRSVREYFLEVSGGLFTIENAGIHGWYDSDYPPSEYWPGTDNPGRDSGTEAIRKASADIDFSAFDLDGDGALARDEIGILFVIPGMGNGGGLGRCVDEDYVKRQDATGITVDGVHICPIVEVSLGTEPGIVAHELAHLFLEAGDMYHDSSTNKHAAGPFSLMDQHGDGPHIDPAHRLKLGWLKPRLIYRSGRYSLDSIEAESDVLVLADPTHGTGEYFIIENRWGAGSFDSFLPVDGVGIWHVIESPSVWKDAPPGVAQKDWDEIGNPGGWSRKGIRMIRPGFSPRRLDTSLWDGTNPATGYPLLPDDPDPSHAELRWADGTPSPFSIRDVSAPGETVQLTIDVAGVPAYEPVVRHRVCADRSDLIADPSGASGVIIS